MLMFVAGVLCGACFGAVALGICYSAVSSGPTRGPRWRSLAIWPA